MKKQAVSNGSVKDEPSEKDDAFIAKLKQTTSVVDFYRLKSEIIERIAQSAKR